MNSNYILEVECDWHGKLAAGNLECVVHALESGKVIYLPHLSFPICDNEISLLDSKWAHPKIKNITCKPNGRLKGLNRDVLKRLKQSRPLFYSSKKYVNRDLIEAEEKIKLDFTNLINRFTRLSLSLINGLVPEYSEHLTMAPTSLRLHRTEMRCSSWRSDDSRLHVDAFPSRPVADKRILRVFANINPNNEARIWRLGEPFEQLAKRFMPQISPYRFSLAKLLQLIGVTRSLRTPYDDIMLKFHDAMKASSYYQHKCEQIVMPFASGSVWICFSDQVAHAASSGQFMLEQSFFIRTQNMVTAENSPLKILERLTQKSLLGPSN